MPTITSSSGHSVADLVDGLAATATVVMGEEQRSSPLAIIEQVPDIEFLKTEISPAQMKNLLRVSGKEVYDL